MSSHERYEQLCALAAVGEISAEDLEELKTHLKDCASCHKAFADMRELHSNWFPERPGFKLERSSAAESRLRGLILRRATAEGAHFSDAAVGSQPHYEVPRTRFGGFLHPSLSLGAGILIAAVGIGVAALTKSHNRAPVQTTVASVQSPVVSDHLDSANPEVSQAEARQAQYALELALKRSLAEITRLEQRLEEAERRASDLQQVNSEAVQEVPDLRRQLEAVRANQVKTEEELAKMKSSQSDKESELILAREEIRELHDKVTEQSASLDRERELMVAGREIRDLIAARNLHIIDVYDTNGNGTTKKAFGRVFYTEGKSLVFYAYDLAPRHPATKYAYYAWGKRDDQQGKVRNLGIFYNDDQTQKRWVFKITDPQVLSEIDSVFVTLEPVDNPGTQPSGKKLLSAYLGSAANHP